MIQVKDLIGMLSILDQNKEIKVMDRNSVGWSYDITGINENNFTVWIDTTDGENDDFIGTPE